MAEEVRLGGMFVDLRARTAAFAAGFIDADKRLAAHQRQLRRNRRAWQAAKRDLAQLTGGATSLRNLGLAAVGAGAGLGVLIRQQANYADELRSNARLSNQSIASLQVWSAALASSRNDQDSVADGFRELALRQREAIDGNLDVAHAARLAGLRLEDETGKARDVKEVLRDLARIIPTLTHGTGVSILDRLGGEDLQLLYGVLSKGTDELDRRLAQARTTAKQLTEEQAAALIDLGEGLDRIEIAARAALGHALAGEADRVDGILEGIENRLPALIEGFLSFSEKAAGGLELVVEHGREILSVLAALRGVAAGAALGGIAGSAFGPIGTALGPILGGLAGASAVGGGAYYGLGQLGKGADQQPGIDPSSREAVFLPAGQGYERFRPADYPRRPAPAAPAAPAAATPPAAEPLGGGGGLLVTAAAAAAARADGLKAGQEYVRGLMQGVDSRARDLKVSLGRAVEIPAELLDIERRGDALGLDLKAVRVELRGLAEDSDEAIKRKAELTLQEAGLVRELAAVVAGRERIAGALKIEQGLTQDLSRERAAAAVEERDLLAGRAAAHLRFEEATRQHAEGLARQRDLVRQVGYAFAGFTTDSIRGVDALSDRITRLAEQITDLLTQRLIVEPLVNLLSSSLVPAGGGGILGSTQNNVSVNVAAGAGATVAAAAGDDLGSQIVDALNRPSSPLSIGL